jgi:CMP-N-acetylneuraminic acid synthetase
MCKPICIIPARSGSVRIKDKNIYKINNKPMIAHTIKLLINSNMFSRVIVSTDAKKIANIAIKYGAEAPFLRNKRLSNSKSTIKDTIMDAIKKLKSYHCPVHFVVYPTAILIEKKDLVHSLKMLNNNTKANTVLAVVENNSFYRSFVIKKKNEIVWKWKNFQNKMSQDLPKAFMDSGTFFLFKTKSYLKSKDSLTNPILFYEIDKKKGIDVNTKNDLFLLKLINANKKTKN